jgi:shikimate dehydrogenase
MDYGLIGEKLGHSYSQVIHGMLGDYRYDLTPVAPEALDAFLRAREFRGLNVTIPYKKAVIPYCDCLGDTAKKIGSVNTLVFDAQGRMWGHNTDYAGFACMARRAGVDFSGKKVLILGTGGTALTTTAVASDGGAREIIPVSRRGTVDYETVYDIADADVIINTTPVGMYPQNGESPLDLSRFPALSGVLDVVYNPLKTALVIQAETLGIPCSGGLPMLVAQAAAAYGLFFGSERPDTETERIIRQVQAQMTNIVLIGMPGSGKSAVGQNVAGRMSREFVDLDYEIEKKAGMTIPEIFSRYGEARFRQLETEIAEMWGARNGLVIATGGGTVLHQRNYAPLHQNGRIYHLRRELDCLPMEGRPLSTSREALEEMAAQRAPLYAAFRDVEIENNGTVAGVGQRIVEEFHEHFSD